MPRKVKSAYDLPPKAPLTTLEEITTSSAPRPPRRGRTDDASELRARARRAGAESRATMALNVRVSVPVYKALVELAEEYHQPVTVITKQCLEDGIRKYRDFSVPGLNPFASKLPLTRIMPDLVPSRPARPSVLDRAASRNALAQEMSQPVVVSDDDVALFDVTQAMEEFIESVPPGLLAPSTLTHKNPPKESDDQVTE